MNHSQVPKIDVHHHSFPPAYVEYLETASQNPGGWVTEPWTLHASCDFCQSKSIDIAILSCIPGGPHSDVNLTHAQDFTKKCNEYNSQIVGRSPRSFGFFAHVTNLCEVDLTLKEIEYAFDHLGADGIALGTSYHMDGQLNYLGDPLFAPVWDALDLRRAVVFVHPVPSASIVRINRNLPPPAFEFPHETGRTAIDMITNPSNMLRDHAASCKIILSHAGGTLPYLIDRIAGLMCHGPVPLRLEKSSDQVLAEARRFYYDTALSSSPMHMSALTSLLGPDTDRLLFGTDFPPASMGAIDYNSVQLRKIEKFKVDALRTNALKLFPRLQNQIKLSEQVSH